jgi:hypothetical protein
LTGNIDNIVEQPGKYGVLNVGMLVASQGVENSPLAGEELGNGSKLLTVSLRPLSSGERLRAGGIMQPIRVMHAPHECNVVHHAAEMREML